MKKSFVFLLYLWDSKSERQTSTKPLQRIQTGIGTVYSCHLRVLKVGKLSPDMAGLPLGNIYVAFFASFNAKLNKNVLDNVIRSDAIDDSKYPLFGCRFVPGFGLQVSQGLTVWTVCQDYFRVGKFGLCVEITLHLVLS